MVRCNVVTAITCTATTRLSADECMARLAACPALPRGERLEWVLGQARWQQRPLPVASWTITVRGLAGALSLYGAARSLTLDNWRKKCAPLRKAREQRQQYRKMMLAVVELRSITITNGQRTVTIAGGKP